MKPPIQFKGKIHHTNDLEHNFLHVNYWKHDFLHVNCCKAFFIFKDSLKLAPAHKLARILCKKCKYILTEIDLFRMQFFKLKPSNQ